MSYTAAVVQLNSTSDSEANWEQARGLVSRAAEAGARLVATPENTNFLGPHQAKVERAETLEGPTCERFSALAADLGIFVLLGSFNERSEDPQRCFNTSVLYGPGGEQLAVYRKIHLFDVDVSPQVRFSESSTVEPGKEVVVVTSELGTLGLTVCYDLRFPGLYQTLRDRGAEIVTGPAAFTATTGKDHWHPLLRARAIENGAFVLAPAQCGTHAASEGRTRSTWGHSLAIDPWGRILADGGDLPGVTLVDLDLSAVDDCRIDGVDMNDPGVIQRCQRLGLALESVESTRIRSQGFWQDLDGHLAPKLGVFGAIHLTHAAFAELGGDLEVGK